MKQNNWSRSDSIAAAILIFGTALRFYKLAQFPFHPDEAIHAWFALGLGSYHYDPIYHGPLLYHLVAAVFKVFGVNDWAARFVPAVLGVLLLWLVLWPGRRFMTERAALWSGAMLAVSPVVVAYSRRLLHDSLVLVLTLSAVFCFQVALENASTSPLGRRARVGLVAILTLFIATKANAFFIMAMLLSFWVARKLLMPGHEATREPSIRFDYQTPLLCAGVTLLLFAFLFGRGVMWARVLDLQMQKPEQAQALLQSCAVDVKTALPHMIEYWGGQQKHPRLPGPHDYYFVLMLLYELPLCCGAAWGTWRALINRTPFTDLLLWWVSTSVALYAIANEKVPWLLVHQMLPMCLLAGYGIAQIELKTVPRKIISGAVVLAAGIFLLRHIEATNFARAADRHEPLLFAQTTETYRDTLFEALESTASQAPGAVWVEGSEQWPSAWYLRDASPLLNGSRASWAEAPPDESTLRVVLCSHDTWQTLRFSGRFGDGWQSHEIVRYIWPRPSWKSLTPQVFAGFWLHRRASLDNGVLNEDSIAQSVIARSKPSDSLGN